MNNKSQIAAVIRELQFAREMAIQTKITSVYSENQQYWEGRADAYRMAIEVLRAHNAERGEA